MLENAVIASHNVLPSNKLHKLWRQNLTVLGFLLGVSAVLWLPFGFNISCWADGWVNFTDVARGNLILWGGSRPFVFISNWLGYILDPNSFVGLNFVVFVLFFLTGLLLYLILHQLEVPRMAAVAAGALAIVYPADNIKFYLGASNIHFAVVCYLLGAYILVNFHRTHRWWLVPLMWFTLLLSIGTYEVGYPLILLTPIILLLRRPSPRRFLITSAVWYVAPALNLIHIYVLSRQNPSLFGYQASLLANKPSLAEMFQSLLNAYKNVLYTGWTASQGVSQPITYNIDVILGIVSGIITLSTLVWLITRDKKAAAPPDTQLYPLILGLVGLASIGLGFALYLPSSLRDAASRTLYYSSVGGAVVIAAALWLLAGFLPVKRLFFPILISTLVGLGVMRLLDQHAASIALPNQQNEILLDTLKHIPNIEPGSAVIVIDESPDTYLQKVFPSSFYFEPPIQLALRDFSVQAGICYPKLSTPWAGAFQEKCTFGQDGVALSFNQQPFLQSDFRHLIVLRFTPDHHLELQSDLSAYMQNSTALNAYQPDKLIDANGSMPSNAASLLPVVQLPD